MTKENEAALEQIQFEELISGLIENGYGCCDNFLSQEIIDGLRVNILSLNELGDLKPAGIGKQQDFQKNERIRGDKINWIEEDATLPFEELYLSKIWRFINHLNQTCFTSIKTFECHYSNYPKGRFYKRHLDQFKSENGRKYSTVLYLNKNWKDEDEGNLYLYPITGAQKNIAPEEGRFVFFESDQMEHEVHPSSTRERNSIAGWLKN
jgi:SM-20-related protein